MLILFNTHRIIEYFPFLKNEKKSANTFYNEFNKTYENIKKELKSFYEINLY